MSYWLMKSEPDEVSMDDLARLHRVPWFGVRNYQARNFMRDAMVPGDEVLFYHSGCSEPGIAGLARVVGAPRVDDTQFDPASSYFDAKSSPDNPRWVCVEVEFIAKTRFVSLAELRAQPELASLQVLRRGNRLSITPVDPAHWHFITQRLMQRMA